MLFFLNNNTYFIIFFSFDFSMQSTRYVFANTILIDIACRWKLFDRPKVDKEVAYKKVIYRMNGVKKRKPSNTKN